jgi:hypothetical protein
MAHNMETLISEFNDELSEKFGVPMFSIGTTATTRRSETLLLKKIFG